MSRWVIGSGLAAITALASLAGCGNPALDTQINELGGEVPGVEASEYHRPGQPCLVCHGPYDGAKPQMLIGGTIFALPTSGKPTPVEGAKVFFSDSAGQMATSKETNCVGNFYIEKGEVDLVFPMAVTIECPDPNGGPATQQAMTTQISREGSCNACHKGDRNQGSPGWIFCLEQPPNPYPAPGTECPGVPKAGAQ